MVGFEQMLGRLVLAGFKEVEREHNKLSRWMKLSRPDAVLTVEEVHETLSLTGNCPQGLLDKITADVESDERWIVAVN